MRSRISIRGYVRPSVRPSVGRFVGPSVTHELKPCKSAVFDQNYYQCKRERILCRVSGLVLFFVFFFVFLFFCSSFATRWSLPFLIDGPCNYVNPPKELIQTNKTKCLAQCAQSIESLAFASITHNSQVFQAIKFAYRILPNGSPLPKKRPTFFF